jgi:hypothetical protein
MIRFNKNTVTIPFFQVGQPEIDLESTLKNIEAAKAARKAGKNGS